MLIKKLDVSIVDPPCNLLANLVRAATLNHVQSCPTILRLSTRRRANKQGVLEFALKPVLLDIVGQSSRDFPVNKRSALSG